MKRLYIVTFILGLLYVGLRLSPSSYALVLEHTFRVAESERGVIAGSPRLIRSDEFAHFTPWTQAVVNNNFKRYNENSPYREDFRTVFPMPVFDWGMIFKPFMWLYPAAPPAFAFSFYWYFMMVSCILGWTTLFIQRGFGTVLSLGAALIIFFSAFIQYWWSNNCGTFALFPWTVVASLYFLKLPSVRRLLLFYWVATTWFFALFYPPFIIELSFLGVVIILSSRQKFTIKNIFLLGIAALASLGTALWYFFDELMSIKSSPLQGLREFGGGGMPWKQYAAHFFPSTIIDNHESLIGANICEISVVGSILIVMTLCLIRWKEVAKNFFSVSRLPLLVPIAAFLIVSLWELLPLPALFGKIFFWNRVPPMRMGIVSGSLIILVALELLASFTSTISLIRATVFLVINSAVFLLVKLPIEKRFDWFDAVIVVVPLIFWVANVVKRKITEQNFSIPTVAVYSSLGVNMVLFGAFNPLQSTVPIFERPQTVYTEKLDAIAEKQGGKILAVPEDFGVVWGATISGYGYPSINHALFSPQTVFFRKIYPTMPNEEFEQIFNRSAHVQVDKLATAPSLPFGNVINIPLKDLASPDSGDIPYFDSLVTMGTMGGGMPSLDTRGSLTKALAHIDRTYIDKNNFVIEGWSFWKGNSFYKQLLILGIPKTPQGTSFSTIVRKDVSKKHGLEFIESGFRATLSFKGIPNFDSSKLCYVIVNRSRKNGYIAQGSNKETCKAYFNKK